MTANVPLTDQQKHALVWLPADGSVRVTTTEMRPALLALLAARPDYVEQVRMHSHSHRYRLTAAGMKVRKAIMEASKDGVFA